MAGVLAYAQCGIAGAFSPVGAAMAAVASIGRSVLDREASAAMAAPTYKRRLGKRIEGAQAAIVGASLLAIEVAVHAHKAVAAKAAPT